MKRTIINSGIIFLFSLNILCNLAEANIAVSNVITSGWTRMGNITEGWQFTPTNPINVTHLGMWDDSFEPRLIGNSTGFNYQIPIGIWQVSNKALLRSTTLGPGTINPAIDGYRYSEITPILLSPGELYVIGFQWSDIIVESEWVQSPEPGNFQIDPFITIGSRVFNFSSNPGFLFPEIVDQGFPGTTFGPNFQFTIIPAPGALLLCSIGASLVTWLRRRRTL